MAQFTVELPKEILNQFDKILFSTDKIFGKMTREGAKVVANNVRASAPVKAIRDAVVLTKTYKTPSDDGINTKVRFRGAINDGKAFTRRAKTGGTQYTTYKGTPVEFIAMITEYGTSARYTNNGRYTGYIGKRPFFRRAFDSAQITAAMLKVQEKETGGLLKQ